MPASYLCRRSVLAWVGATIMASPAAAQFIPQPELLGEKWKATGNGGDPDYGPWADFLSKWLRQPSDGVTRVDYAGAVAANARAPLKAWLDQTQKIDPTTLSSSAAFAWWTNLYNAATIDLVLKEYPVRTILQIEGGLFNTGPWDEKILSVNGEALTLNNVEHGILRPIWNDPRVHYAVNCASIGCPNLKATPWTSATLESDLEAGAKAYVNHPRGAQVENGQLVVSKIYDWFEVDFGGSTKGVLDHLRQYAEGQLAKRLANIGRISNSRYDWNLNAA